MRRSLVALVAGALILFLGPRHVQAQGEERSLSSPQAAIEAHYAGLKSLDLDLLRKVHGDVAWVNKAEIARLNSLRLRHKIVAISPMKGQSSSSGDVYVRVKEYFKNTSSPALMHFELRRIDGSWMIVNFNAEELPPKHPREVVRPNREEN